LVRKNGRLCQNLPKGAAKGHFHGLCHACGHGKQSRKTGTKNPKKKKAKHEDFRQAAVRIVKQATEA